MKYNLTGKLTYLMLLTWITWSFNSNAQEFNQLDSLLNSLKSSPENYLTHKRLGDLYRKQRDSLAIKHYQLYLQSLSEDSIAESQAVQLIIAETYYQQRQRKKALALIDQLENQYREDPLFLGHASYTRAKLLYSSGILDKSLAHYNAAINYFDVAGSKLNLARTYNKKGVTEKNLGNFSSALKSYLKSLEYFKEIKDEEGFSLTLMNVGVVYKNQGDYKRALKYYRQAQNILRNINNLSGLANVYSNIGVVYKKEGKYDRALNEYMKALDIHERLGNSDNLGNVLHNVGTCLHQKGESQEALTYLYRAIQEKAKSGSSFRLSSSYNSLAEVYTDLNQLDSALINNNKALQYAVKTGSPELLLNIYETRTTLMVKMNDLEEFEKSWEKFKEIDDTLETIEKTKLIYQIQSDYDLQVEAAIKESREKKEVIEKSKEREAKLQSEISKEKRREKQLEQALIIGGFILLSLLALSLYTRVRSSRKSRQELEEKNVELQKTLLSKEEKEVLLKEIHHRVKNNMQIIMSLLRLQSANINDAYIQSLYTESQNRIKSMALVHEELYQTRDLTDVNVKNYLEKLIQNLIENYSLKTNIVTNSNIEVNSLGIDTLIPLGLLLNEIISNTFKHAFIGQSDGVIYVELNRLEDETICLKVGDNGIGFAQDWNKKDSLGQELIESLVEQLDGTMEIRGDRGVHYLIHFKEQ